MENKISEIDFEKQQKDKRVPASLISRFLAFSIDRLLCFLFLFNLSYFLPTDSYYFFSIIRLCEQMIPTVIIYHVIFELCWNGLTPGKKICRIRVVKENYEPLNIEAVFTRNFLRFCDVLPAFYITGIIAMLKNKKRQRTGDFSAGTLVVREESIGNEILNEQILSNNNPDLPSTAT